MLRTRDWPSQSHHGHEVMRQLRPGSRIEEDLDSNSRVRYPGTPGTRVARLRKERSNVKNRARQVQVRSQRDHENDFVTVAPGVTSP
eukprot:1090354-Rhodomonas_salina.1